MGYVRMVETTRCTPFSEVTVSGKTGEITSTLVYSMSSIFSTRMPFAKVQLIAFRYASVLTTVTLVTTCQRGVLCQFCGGIISPEVWKD